MVFESPSSDGITAEEYRLLFAPSADKRVLNISKTDLKRLSVGSAALFLFAKVLTSTIVPSDIDVEHIFANFFKFNKTNSVKIVGDSYKGAELNFLAKRMSLEDTLEETRNDAKLHREFINGLSAKPELRYVGSVGDSKFSDDNYIKHCVIKDDKNLISIAERYGMNYMFLSDFNELKDPGKIRVGQVLRIPTNIEYKPLENYTGMSRDKIISELRSRTISRADKYLEDLVDVCLEVEYNPFAYSSLVWQETGFGIGNYGNIVNLNPKYHLIPDNASDKEIMRISVSYLKKWTDIYSDLHGQGKGVVMGLAAYNCGPGGVGELINKYGWDGSLDKDRISKIPDGETKTHLENIAFRLKHNYDQKLLIPRERCIISG